ncbi:batten disease protein CLN3 [Ceratobasidium sp. AG-Ba]|nr:batten disease protein CLN3 [Ceratobasidium sp. AG-Ba]
MRDLDETPPEQPLLSTPDSSELNEKAANRLRLFLGGSFFLFGLMNNVLYVIILSAALDLVPPSTPKGIIAFCNIAPALIAKVGWPYFLKGKIQYTRRLLSCCALSVSGMLIVAAFETLSARLLGIAFASFASGLGELTFLQLSTTYHPGSLAGHCVGYFASGTGAAGLVGAGLWWELRGLGVRLGVGLSAILPFSIPITYFLALPPPDDYTPVVGPGTNWSNAPSEYTAIPEDETEPSDGRPVGVAVTVTPHHGLTPADKWRLVRPLLLRYMLPLFCVYTFEYTINQGISPTLVYPVPAVKDHPILGGIIKSTRDYYPLWQLIYQAFVFLSRSSISLGMPALPAGMLPVPSIVQGFIMSFLALEAATGFLSGGQPESTTQGSVLPILMLLIATEGICGGLAYVNVFYRVGQDSTGVFDRGDSISQERARQEQEFRIGSIGFADSSGILVASLIAMPTEVGLCHAQVQRGKLLCKDL